MRVIPVGFVPSAEANELHSQLMGLFDAENPAPCELNPDAWFESAAPEWVLDSCRGCRAIETCLLYAMTAEENFGTWGGLDEKERRRRSRHARKGITNGGQAA